MAAIKDVAMRAGLSVSAVSKYLKRSDSVRQDTRERIERAIQELHYVPSAAARSLRTGLTGMLTVISPNITNPFFAELFRDIQHFASNYGYTTILQTQDDTHAPTLFDRLSWNGSVGVDGIIVCFPDDDTVVDYVNRYCPETPIVYLTWHPLNERVQSAVLLDVENGLYIATRHLLSQGHRLIGYI
ncbi:MAG: LacI family DNA-binding transcriptional regulator, partial [Clostridia bacterium]